MSLSAKKMTVKLLADRDVCEMFAYKACTKNHHHEYTKNQSFTIFFSAVRIALFQSIEYFLFCCLIEKERNDKKAIFKLLVFLWLHTIIIVMHEKYWKIHKFDSNSKKMNTLRFLICFNKASTLVFVLVCEKC